MDAPLHADFRGPSGDGFCHTLTHLIQGQGESIGVGLTLGKCTEAAARVANVGEIDVPVHHIGNVLPHNISAQGVGDARQFHQRGPSGLRQQFGLIRMRGEGLGLILRPAQRRLHLCIPTLWDTPCLGLCHSLSVLGNHRPIAERLIEITANIRHTTGLIDRRRQVTSTRTRRLGELAVAVRFLPRQPAGLGAIG